jgi:hypothetical protein
MEKKQIEKIIRNYITKHLVLHTPTPNDNRCRLEIMLDECSTELYNEFKKELDRNNPSNLASEAVRQDIISKLKEKLDEQIKINGEINKNVTDSNQN